MAFPLSFSRSFSKIHLAVDASNLYLNRGQSHGAPNFINYGALLAFAGKLGHMCDSALYVPTNNTEREQSFVQAVGRLGYRVIARPWHVRPEGGRKSDLDLVVIMDVMEAIANGHIDCLVLVSGDRDFTSLVHLLEQNNIPAMVIGPEHMTSSELAAAAWRFTPAEKISGLITEWGRM